MRLVITVLVWFGLVTPSVAQNSPSAAETVAFLNGLLNCEGSEVVDFPAVHVTEYEKGSASIAGNALSVATERRLNKWHKARRHLESTRVRGRFQVPMAHFDPVAERDGTQVTVRCNPTHGSCITETYVRVDEGSRPIDASNDGAATTFRTFLMCNERDAESFVKGWNHLITLYGGTGRLFD